MKKIKNENMLLKKVTLDGKQYSSAVATIHTVGDHASWSPSLTADMWISLGILFQGIRATFGAYYNDTDNSHFDEIIYGLVKESDNCEGELELDIQHVDAMREQAAETYKREVTSLLRDNGIDNENAFTEFLDVAVISFFAENILTNKAKFLCHMSESFLLTSEVHDMHDSMAMLDADVGIEELCAMGRAKMVVGMTVYDIDGVVVKYFATREGARRWAIHADSLIEQDYVEDFSNVVESLVTDPAKLTDETWLVLVSDNDQARATGPIINWDKCVELVK